MIERPLMHSWNSAKPSFNWNFNKLCIQKCIFWKMWPTTPHWLTTKNWMCLAEISFGSKTWLSRCTEYDLGEQLFKVVHFFILMYIFLWECCEHSMKIKYNKDGYQLFSKGASRSPFKSVSKFLMHIVKPKVLRDRSTVIWLRVIKSMASETSSLGLFKCHLKAFWYVSEAGFTLLCGATDSRGPCSLF